MTRIYFYVGNITLEVEKPGHPGKARCIECKKSIFSETPRLARWEVNNGQEWKRYFCPDCGIQYIRELKQMLNQVSEQLWSLSQHSPP